MGGEVNKSGAALDPEKIYPAKCRALKEALAEAESIFA